MRNRIKVNEATFKRIIAESVKGVLSEISPELKAAAAMTAAHRAQNVNDPYYKIKYDRQAQKFANSAASDYAHENPEMLGVYFNPYNKSATALFNNRNTINGKESYLRHDITPDKSGVYSEPHYNSACRYEHYFDNKTGKETNFEPEEGYLKNPNLTNNDFRRYGRFKNKLYKTYNQIANYQPKD